MCGIYANIWGILMGSMLPYIACMDPMGMDKPVYTSYNTSKKPPVLDHRHKPPSLKSNR